MAAANAGFLLIVLNLLPPYSLSADSQGHNFLQDMYLTTSQLVAQITGCPRPFDARNLF